MKTSVILLLLWVIVYIIVIYFYEDIDKILSLTGEISLQSSSTLMGIIIGSVGILIGTISGLYTILIDIHKNRKELEDNSTDLDKLEEVVLELKENTISLIVIYFLNLTITYALNLDFEGKIRIPYYTELYPLLSKEAVLTSINIFLIILGIWITYDIITTIFTIFQAYILVTKSILFNEKKS